MSTPPEHPSQNSNNTKNEKRDTDNTNIKKESVNSKSTVYTSFSNNFLDIDDEVTTIFSMRVPVSVYNYYRTELSGREQRLVREVLKQVFVNLVMKRVEVQHVENKQVFSVNVNVQQVLRDEDERGGNIVKLKRELERLQRELEKSLAENVELKRELERVSRQRDELQRQLHSIKHYDGSGSALNSAVFDLAVIAECLETQECNKQKLLNFVKREYEKLSKYARQPKQEFVSTIVKMLQQ